MPDKKDEGLSLWLIALVLFCLLVLPFAVWWDGKQAALSAVHPAPPFKLTSSAGKSVSLADLKGKVWLADFVLLNCSTQCPIVSAAMARFQNKWKAKGLELVSFALDSKGRSAELKKYAKDMGADPSRWFFLTGEYKDLLQLGIQGFHLPDAAADGGSNFLHSSRITLVDSKGLIRGYYDGLSPDDLQALDKALARLLE